MRRIANGLIGCAWLIGVSAMCGCSPQLNSFGNSSHGSSSAMGSQGTFNGSGTYVPPSPAGTVAGGAVDPNRSQGLTDYLQSHHLPLVSGRVVSGPNGAPEVILYGYVASEFGKSDAEQKARTYLNQPNVLVDNRISISPELAGSNASSGSNGGNGSNGGSPSSSNDPYASAGSVQDYQNQQFDPYAAQQQYQYQQQGNGASGMMMSPGLGMLLGLIGGSFGGGGVGIGAGGGSFGGGGFGAGGSSGYGGYGYPSYPPPSPGFSTFP
jgi:hypothetical protein